MEQIIIKLLDWPFLLFIILCLFLILFLRQLRGILDRGDITISWGENRTIRITDLSKSLDEELDPIRDEIEAIKKAVEYLESKAQVPIQERIVPIQDEKHQESDSKKVEAQKRMLEALGSEKFHWRSIERLAVIGGVSEDEALDILRSDPRVVLSVGKSRRRIASLKTK